ncbi:MAG: tetratricopeptide repeat protein [Desulfobacterales bacterium]|nr:MAG: tetratricopeptide repeat protein [Desulfobacterales bacterium]
MGILDFFSKKDPEDYEQKGDAFFEAEAYGKAIVEYEQALARLEKTSPWDDGYRNSLREKISTSREKLALAHEKTAEELMEAGHNDDARQYIELAQELTRDPRLKSNLDQHLQNLEKQARKAFQTTLPNFDVSEQDDQPPEAPDDPGQDDEYFAALVGTLPEEVQESYLSYPEVFKTGYLALNRGDFEQAAKDLSQAMQEHAEPQSYIQLELATAHLNLGQYDEACRLAESFLKYRPDALPAYQLLCEIFWETKAFDRTDALLSSLPEELTESVAAYVLRGENLYQAEKYAEAKEFYRNFLKKYEWHETVARALAKTHEALGERTNARYIYGEIMNHCRSCHTRIDPEIKQKFADLSLASGLNTSEVLEMYLSLAREIPQNAADYYNKISRIYAAQGNEEESRRFRLIAEKYENKE